MSYAKADGYTRKARALHRRADALLGKRPADALRLRMKAKEFEACAALERDAAVDTDEDDGFYDDDDLPTVANVRPREAVL